MPQPGTDPNTEQQISELLSQGEAFFDSRNFGEAITLCKEVLAMSPEHPRARELMDKAQSRLEADIFTQDNLRKAEDYLKQRDFQKCINECQKIQLLDPDNPLVTDVLNRAQEKLEAEPFVENFINSGRSLFESGLYSEAIGQWEKVKAIDPEYPGLEGFIENARKKMAGSSDGGAQMFRLEPEDYQQQPTINLDLGGQEGFGFVSEQEKIRELMQKGDELYAGGQYQKAIEVWSEIFMIDVNHQEALEKIEKARKTGGEQRAKVKDTLKTAQMAYEQGDIARAADLFRQVKSIDPENAEAEKYLSLMETPEEESVSLEDLIARGEAAEQQSQYRNAAQYFSQALAIDSENAELADRIKNLNLLAKKQEQGRALIGNARAFVAERKLDSARHALSKILETDPGNQEAMELLQEVKKLASSGPAVAEAAAPKIAKRPGKAFPLVPAAVIGGLVLVGGAAALWFTVFRNPEPDQTVNIPIQRPPRTGPAKANPSQQTPGNATAQNGSTAPPEKIEVTPITQAKAVKLVEEANFYYREKHYHEALDKAQEALRNDPVNKDAIGAKLQAEKAIQDMEQAEKKLLVDADQYFGYSEFAGAERLYQQYLQKHPEAKDQIQPQIVKCYYNMGVLAIREWRCDVAADYFRQVLFIDETDKLSKDALAIARQCEKSGTTDIEVRKAVALMEMRR